MKAAELRDVASLGTRSHVNEGAEGMLMRALFLQSLRSISIQFE